MITEKNRTGVDNFTLEAKKEQLVAHNKFRPGLTT